MSTIERRRAATRDSIVEHLIDPSATEAVGFDIFPQSTELAQLRLVVHGVNGRIDL